MYNITSIIRLFARTVSSIPVEDETKVLIVVQISYTFEMTKKIQIFKSVIHYLQHMYQCLKHNKIFKLNILKLITKNLL